jgi:hypothetical protein
MFLASSGSVPDILDRTDALKLPSGTNTHNGEKVGREARGNTSLGTHQSRKGVTVLCYFLWLRGLEEHAFSRN